MMTDDTSQADIRFEHRAGYLFAIVSGRHDSLDVSLDYWRRVIGECYASNYEKLLVVEDFPNQLGTIEIYEIVQAIAAMVNAPMKIAFVDRNPEMDSLNLFGETVAVNRGVFGRIFSDQASAEVWLLSDQK